MQKYWIRNKMATLGVYDINSFVSSHPSIVSLLGRSIDIFPNVGYADEKSPFMVYMFSMGIPDVEAFWHRVDHIAYLIYDTDIDRAFQIAEILIDILGKGDQISQSGGVAGTDSRILSTQLTAAYSDGPQERDGWYRMDIEFSIHHVKR